MTGKTGDEKVCAKEGVPEPMVDHSELLTRPVYSGLLREASADPKKLELLRAIAGQRLKMTNDKLQEEVAKVFGHPMTLQEVLSVVDIFSSTKNNP